MSEKTKATPNVDPDTLKGNEIARSVIGTGIKPPGFRVEFKNGVVQLRGTLTSEEERQRVLTAVRGNAGVREVNDEMQIGGAATVPGTKSLGGQSYTVQKGDTLTEIAQKHYGKASDFKKIFEANRDVLSDPNKIQVGQVLKLP